MVLPRFLSVGSLDDGSSTQFFGVDIFVLSVLVTETFDDRHKEFLKYYISKPQKKSEKKNTYSSELVETVNDFLVLPPSRNQRFETFRNTGPDEDYRTRE